MDAVKVGAVKAGSGSCYQGGCHRGGFRVVVINAGAGSLQVVRAGYASRSAGRSGLGLLCALQVGRVVSARSGGLRLVTFSAKEP